MLWNGLPQPPVGASRTDPGGSTFDFHGLYRVRVNHRALATLMRTELGSFLSDSTRPDLTIDEGAVPRLARSLAGAYRYDDAVFVVETGSGRIAIGKDHILAEPHVDANELLGHWVENIMKMENARQGVCFVHSAAISRDGVGYLLPAWMGSGKTHVLLHALSRRYSFMADDWCFISRSGQVMAYPRWPSLAYQHFKANPWLRNILANGSGDARLKRCLAVNDFADSLQPSSELGRRFRRFLYNRFYVSVRPPLTQMFPEAESVLSAPVSRVALLVASDQAEVDIRRVPTEEIARRTVWSGTYERSRYSAHRLAIAYAGKGAPPADTTALEAAFLSEAFSRASCFEVTLPSHPQPRDLDFILNELANT